MANLPNHQETPAGPFYVAVSYRNCGIRAFVTGQAFGTSADKARARQVDSLEISHAVALAFLTRREGVTSAEIVDSEGTAIWSSQPQEALALAA